MLTKEWKALSSAIVGSESDGSYDILNGNKRFNDYTDHPFASTNKAFGYGVAAGKFQFMPATWNEYKKKLNLPDFSPDSQEKAAYQLAKDRYKQKTGNDLQTDLELGKLKEVAKALSPTWTSLPSGKEGNKATNGFYKRYSDALNGNVSGESSKVSTIPASIDSIFESPNSTDITPEEETFLESVTPDLPDFEDIGLRIGFGVLGMVILGFGLFALSNQTINTVTSITKKKISKGLIK